MKKTKKLIKILLIGTNVLLVSLVIFCVIVYGSLFKLPLITKDNLTKKTPITYDFTQFLPHYKSTDLSEYKGPVANYVPILMYHDIVAEKPVTYDGNKTFIDDFQQQMAYLSEQNYHTLTVEEFMQFYRAEIDIPEKSVLITFDDGFLSIKTLVEPILKQYNLHAVSFIIGEKTVNEPEWFVSPADIVELKKRNFIEFQSHSYGLHNWGNNKRGMIETVTSADMLLDVSKEEEVIGKSTIFCYPFGHYNTHAQLLLEQTGFFLAVTTEFGYATREKDAFALPRIRINADISLEIFAALLNN